MPISALPTPPSRSDAPQDFSDRADALLGALPGFVTEANALQSDVNAKEASASSYATIATDKAAEAQASATTASTKADEAAASAAAAAAAASNAEIAFDSFDDKYLGSKANDPTTDNDGNALLVGALYWNTTVGAVRVWNGSAWISMAADASIVDFQQAGSGAVVRTAQDKMREWASVKDFGAVGDGATNDTDAIQSAINALNSLGGGRLYFPRGTYIVNGLTVYSNIRLCGDGREASILKLASGANADLIYGAGSNELWGTGSGGGIAGFGIVDMTLDGNRAQNLTAGNCVAIYGEELYFQDVFIKNARDCGMRTEWADADSSFGMEGYFANIRIDSCGKEGWLCNGPHDSTIIGLIIIDASLNADKTYAGLYVGPRMNGRWIGCHVWNRSASNRHSAALNVATGGGGNEFSSCHFEGAWDANVLLLCSGNTFDETCHIYAPWNGVNMYLGQTATTNVVKARFGGAAAGRPDAVAVVLGGVVGDFVADNCFDIFCNAQTAGCFNVTNSDGSNMIRVRGYQASGPIIVGTPHVKDSIDAEVTVGGSKVKVSTEDQSGSIVIPAGAAGIWTFQYAFESAPFISLTTVFPGGTANGGIWVSDLTASSVTVFNNNASSVTVHIRAAL